MPGVGLGSRRVLASLLLLALGLPLGARQGSGPGEYEVKAAFLYNFALYVEWPATAFDANRNNFSIGSVGRDVFNGALERTLAGRMAQGRGMEAVRFATADDVRPCHILYVPVGEKDRLEKIAAALKGTGTLIVTEFDGGARLGAAINFYIEANRVRIEVNAEAAAREGLKVGAKVLRLARIVKDGEK